MSRCTRVQELEATITRLEGEMRIAVIAAGGVACEICPAYNRECGSRRNGHPADGDPCMTKLAAHHAAIRNNAPIVTAADLFAAHERLCDAANGGAR